MNNAFPGLGRC